MSTLTNVTTDLLARDIALAILDNEPTLQSIQYQVEQMGRDEDYDADPDGVYDRVADYIAQAYAALAVSVL